MSLCKHGGEISHCYQPLIHEPMSAPRDTDLAALREALHQAAELALTIGDPFTKRERLHADIDRALEDPQATLDQIAALVSPAAAPVAAGDARPEITAMQLLVDGAQIAGPGGSRNFDQRAWRDRAMAFVADLVGLPATADTPDAAEYERLRAARLSAAGQSWEGRE